MVSNAEFIETKNGIKINPKIAIKLCDFGVAETFPFEGNSNLFLCQKQGLSIENEGYFAPKVFAADLYDARGMH